MEHAVGEGERGKGGGGGACGFNWGGGDLKKVGCVAGGDH